jgi:hypothetical protein
MEEAEAVMSALMQHNNDINRTARTKGPKLPPGCVFLKSPMANLEPEAPVSQWLGGLTWAYVAAGGLGPLPA